MRSVDEISTRRENTSDNEGVQYLCECVGALDQSGHLSGQQRPDGRDAFPSLLFALAQVRVADHDALRALCEHVLDQQGQLHGVGPVVLRHAEEKLLFASGAFARKVNASSCTGCDKTLKPRRRPLDSLGEALLSEVDVDLTGVNTMLVLRSCVLLLHVLMKSLPHLPWQ